MKIVGVVGSRRLANSLQIATLIGRSPDRTNDRLCFLFHHGYLDRPRAQLERFPTEGTAPIVYALANRGARLLCEREGRCGTADWNSNNRRAGRPFIEHQIEIVNFQVALDRAVREHSDLRLLRADEMQKPGRGAGEGFSLRAKLVDRRGVRESTVIPDFVFGLMLPGGKRRNFMVEIDRGTMPVRRSDPTRTSFEAKMRTYVAGHAARQHERQFGWKNFRVLTVTTEWKRVRTMQAAARDVPAIRGSGPSLFLFTTFDDVRAGGPLAQPWLDAAGSQTHLISIQ